MNKFVKVVAGISLCIILSGCQSNPENDIVIGKNDGNLNAAIYEQGNNNIIVDQTEEENSIRYSDTFQGAEDTVKITVDADVIMPDGPFPVIRVAPHEITSAEVERWVNVLFDGNDAYETVTVKTKSEIEEEILRIRQLLGDEDRLWENASTQEDFDYLKSYWEEQLEFYEAQYDSAPETYVRQKTDWQFKKMSEYDYDAELQMTDPEYVYYSQTKLLELVSEVDDCPMMLRAFNRSEDDYHYHALWVYPSSIKNYSNIDKMGDKEHAIQYAEQILEQLGLSHMKVALCEKVEREDTGAIIYNLEFCPTYENTKVIPIPQLATVKGEGDYAAKYFYERLTMQISGERVASITWESPMDVITVENNNVKTLSFDEIMERFRTQMQVEYTLNRATNYNEELDFVGAEIRIDCIEFGLSRIKVENTDNEYYYVPSWSFFGETGTDYGEGMVFYSDISEDGIEIQSPYVTINAIDGSIINTTLGY